MHGCTKFFLLLVLFAGVSMDAHGEGAKKESKIIHLQLIRPSKANNILWRFLSTSTDVALLTTAVTSACHAMSEYSKTGIVNKGLAFANGKTPESHWIFFTGLSAYALGLLILKRSYSEENSAYIAHAE